MKKEQPMATGDCYEASAMTVLDTEDDEMVLCHGMVSGQGELKGKRIDHAWVEYHNLVFDVANGIRKILSKKRYYQIGEINQKQVNRYPRMKALRMLHSTENFGAWTDKERRMV